MGVEPSKPFIHSRQRRSERHHADRWRQVPRVQAQGCGEPGEGQGVQGHHGQGLRGQVAGRLLLAHGLHLHLPDRDRRVRQAERQLPGPRRAGPRREHRHPLRPPGVAQGAPGPQGTCPSRCWPTPSASCPRQLGILHKTGRRAAARDLHRRPRGHHPLGERERPLASAATSTRCSACSTRCRPTSSAPATGRRARRPSRKSRRPDDERARDAAQRHSRRGEGHQAQPQPCCSRDVADAGAASGAWRSPAPSPRATRSCARPSLEDALAARRRRRSSRTRRRPRR